MGILKGFTLFTFCTLLALSQKSKASDDIYQKVFNSVNQDNLTQLLKNLSGVTPVTVTGETFSITERYSPTAKQYFRKYWKAYFESLGLPVTELAYENSHSENGENFGHNMEAVLKGKSDDSLIIIVHYDSMGPTGREASNPGADDDMTGMAMMMETARILTSMQGSLQNTVRFVASDYEEWDMPGLEGAVNYGTYITALAKTKGFKILGAIDDEQTGWNCEKEGQCKNPSVHQAFEINICSTDGTYNYPGLGDIMTGIASSYSSPLHAVYACSGPNSDHYGMWESGIPAIVFSEYSWETNDHFDSNGGDTFNRIDLDYWFKISQIGVTLAAKMAVLN